MYKRNNTVLRCRLYTLANLYWIYVTSDLFHFSASEDLGIVSVPLTRVQGYWGDVEVHFTVHNGTAVLGRDFAVSQYSTTLSDGQQRAHINITILNDNEREFEETFRVQLTSVTGKL